MRGEGFSHISATATVLGLLFLTRVAEAGAIHDAVHAGDLKRVQQLLQVAPEIRDEVDSRGYTPLHIAASVGHKEITLLLLNKGASIDAASTGGTAPGATPLVYAIGGGHTDVALLLLAKGADVNVTYKLLTEKGGYTPLYAAAATVNQRVIRVLVDKGAKTDVQNELEETPLNHMLKKLPQKRVDAADVIRCVRLLINAKVDVNTADHRGVAPMHYAVQQGNFAVVQLLIEAKADVNAQTDKKVRPLTLAMKKGDLRVIKLLKDNGATE